MDYLYMIQQALVWLLTIFWGYQLIISICSLVKLKDKPILETKINKFMAIIPAHNEETVIEALIESLNNQDYPKDKYDIYVIADNCTDKTAEIARRCGYITEGVNKSQFYWLFEYSHYLNNQPSMGYITNVKNPYDINDINYDFLESRYYDNLSIGIANAVHAQLPAPSYNSYNRQNNQGMTNYSQNPEVPSNNLPSPAMQDVDNLSDLIG